MFANRARKDPFYLNADHPANESILKILNTNLGVPSPALVAYFEQCIEYLLRVSANAKGEVNGNPVYADLDSGVIIAAVCGEHAVALRYISDGFRKEALEAGANKTIEIDLTPVDLGAEWIFTDGSFDLKKVHHDLPLSGNYYKNQIRDAQIKASLAEALALGSASPVKADHPSNMAFIKHFQELYPKSIPSSAPPRGYGTWGLGVHPDIPEHIWKRLPKDAQLPDDMGWMVNGQFILVHPTSGVIFACMMPDTSLALRLLQSTCEELGTRSNVTLASEFGENWIRFPAFELKAESISWLALAYNNAE